MELTKTHHESGLGIYAPSRTIETKEDWKAAKEVAVEMTKWMDETNGQFKGEFPRAFAIAHCQVVDHDHPWKLFVVARELVAGIAPTNEKQNLVNSLFEGQVIFNAEVLDAPDKIMRKVPRRQVTKDPKDITKVTVEMVLEDKEISNIISVKEGCMSFPLRSERNIDRKYRVKVRYQYLGKNLIGMTRVETFEGYVEGLKAHIFQHECDHFATKNIHFK